MQCTWATDNPILPDDDGCHIVDSTAAASTGDEPRCRAAGEPPAGSTGGCATSPHPAPKRPRTGSKDKMHSCDECGQAFSTTAHLRRHVARHSKTKPHVCEVCDRSFTELSSLKLHGLIHTGELPYVCEECGQRFRYCYQRGDHVTMMHPRHAAVTVVSAEGSQQPGDTQVQVSCRPTCEICGITVSTRQCLRRHLIVHNPSLKPYRCEQCGQSFRRPNVLRLHMLRHKEVRPHSCDLCGLGFWQQSQLRRHHMTHTGEMPYACPECGRRFRQRYTLRMHVSQRHGGQRPHACNVCDQTFFQAADLRRHALVHDRHAADQNRHKCPKCWRSYGRHSDLRRHVSLQHPTVEPSG